jgi:hypothetical protein
LRYARVRLRCRWEDPGKRRIRSPLHWRDDLETAMQAGRLHPTKAEIAGSASSRPVALTQGLFLPEEHSGGVRRERSRAPLPFALVFPEKADPSGRFTLELTLLQPWLERLPYWLFALGRLKRSKNHPFEIMQGEEWTGVGWERFYDGKEESVERVVRGRGPVVPDLRAGELMLRWVRAGRLLRAGKPMAPLGFPELVEALSRRIRVLERAYGEGGWSGGRELVEKAREVICEPRGLRWVERHRLSRRQKTSVALGGFMGAMLLKGDLEPFGEMLALGRDLGVGKGTGPGVGQVRAVRAMRRPKPKRPAQIIPLIFGA